MFARLIHLCAVFVLVSALAAPAFAQDVPAPVQEALERGDGPEVLRLLTPTAEAGDADAQAILGSLYRDNAMNVPRSPERAAYWIRRAAQQGSPLGQIELGSLYLEGDGVPQSNLQAHVWMSLGLANFGGGPLTRRDLEQRSWRWVFARAEYERDQIESYMTEEDVAESLRLQREWTARRERDH